MRYDLWNVLRRLTDSFVRIYCVFEAELSCPRQVVPHNPELVVRLFRGSEELPDATEALASAGLSREDISARMCKGDMVAIGFLNGIPAAYTWTRFGEVVVKELGLTIRPRRGEAVQYDTLVLKRFRRHGLQFAIVAPVLDYLQQSGCATSLAWVNLFNRPSYKNQRKWGKKLIMTVVWIKLPGMKQRRIFCLGRPLPGLFTNSLSDIASPRLM
jgi:hypothetical protein